MKKLIILLIILTVLLTGCVKPFKYEAYQGENIPTSIKEPVYEVMNDVLNSLKSGDTKVFKKHSHMTSMSDEALQNIEALYMQFQTNYKDVDFSVLDEYFSPSEVDTVTLPFILDDYTMTVAVDGHENYLLLYSGTHNSKELVITSFMIKVEDQWKILHFYIGGYKAAGMKGTEWAKRASQFYEEGKIVPATLSQQIVMELSQLAPIIPHNDKNTFVKNMEMYVQEVNVMYTFPLDISLQDGSKVQLIGAEPGFAGGEIMYIVNYVSALPKIEGNEAKVEAESRLLHKKMLETFKGFDEDIAHVVYKAFEELPFERKAYYSYGTVINIEEQK